MKGRGKTNIAIKGEELQALVDNCPLGREEIATLVLGRDRSYLRPCFKNNHINPKDYEKLCKLLKVDPEDYKAEPVKAEPKTGDMDAQLIPTLAQMYNNQNRLISEVKSLQLQNKELIATLRIMQETMKQISNNVQVNTENVKAISS